VGGILPSSAVPKRAAKRDRKKRLPTAVENHAINHERSDGNLPEGNQGAGHDNFQDKGTSELGRPQSSTTSVRPSSMTQKFVGDSETDEIAWTEAVE